MTGIRFIDLRCIVIASMCVAGFVSAAFSAPPEKSPQDGKHSQETEERCKQLREKIRDEISRIGRHEWAGEYYFGDGFTHVTMALAPDAGYLCEHRGCVGLYDRNFGAVTASDRLLHLSFELPNKQSNGQGIADEFVVVDWGDRKYLVQANGVIGFCNEINSGREPRTRQDGRFLLRRGDEKKAARGLPNIPVKYKAYILPSPITAEIIAVGASTTRPSLAGWEFKDTTVRVNAGKAAGLLPGMRLEVIGPEYIVARVTKVEEKLADAVITQSGEKPVPPQVGWRLSTRSDSQANDSSSRKPNIDSSSSVRSGATAGLPAVK